MQVIDKKPRETPENNFYGIDVNNKEAVEKEYARLRVKHRNITIAVIVMLFVLGFFVFDFVRVYELEGKPIFAISEEVEAGTKYTGIGYEVLYCDNGTRYVGTAIFKKCVDQDVTTIQNLVYKKFSNYMVENKLLNQKKLDSLEFISVTYDGKNGEKGADYHVNLKYSCKTSEQCIKLDKEYYDNQNVHIYVRLDRYNDVYSVTGFKNKGKYYDELVAKFSESLKTYLVTNQKLDVVNLKEFKLELIENHGKYKFRGVSYNDSYLVRVAYTCIDHGNTCVHALDNTDMEGDHANLSFYASMFIGSMDEVTLFGPKEYFDL